MQIGNLKQKANPVLVSFVLGCTFVIFVFLYFLHSSDNIVGHVISTGVYAVSPY